MLALLWWTIGITLIGWCCFPITAKIFPHLPSKGYAFSRGVGLLIWGYIFWILTSIGLTPNSLVGQSIGLSAVLILSLFLGMQWGWRSMWRWLRENGRMIFGVEMVFLMAFVLFALFRSASPAIIGTEKPMELAFLNAILRSPSFPPHDPWLSGFSISYYYFGYLLVAMLARLTGTASGVAFNLAQALWFGLAASSAYGLVIDLFALKANNQSPGRITKWMLRWAALAPVLLLLMGNLFGLLDILHARGIFWQEGHQTPARSGFWDWADIPGLDQPPLKPNQWQPHRSGAVSWWQASRVLEDRTYSGAPVEVIDEFPNFSFVLGDLHPHVLAMPFVLIAIGLALDFFSAPVEEKFKLWKISFAISPWRFFLVSGLIGSLAFLNTWDWPVYASLTAGVFLFRRIAQAGWRFTRLIEFAVFGIGMALVGFVLYLPFFLNFSSQAGGILPSLIFFTRGIHFWVMFGPLLILLMGYLIWQFLERQATSTINHALLITGVFLSVMVLLNIALSVFARQLGSLGDLFMWNFGAQGVPLADLLGSALVRRLVSPGTWLTLGVMMTGCFSLCLAFLQKPFSYHKAVPAFVTLLILWGVLLTFVPEFIYLLDHFGTRMNTIFKFYFQAWILWSIAGAFVLGAWRGKMKATQSLIDRIILGSLVILIVIIFIFLAHAPSTVMPQSLRTVFGPFILDGLGLLFVGSVLIGLVYFIFTRRWGQLFSILVILSIGSGLVYPVMAIPSRARGFNEYETWTLDGNQIYRQSNPDLMAAVDWLWTVEPAVMVEAVPPDGGDYSEFGRVSMLSGMPAVLGWRFHEMQWRGGDQEIGTRLADIALLYETPDWETAKKIIAKYNIEYIYMGDLEYETYQIQIFKFESQLSLVFQNGDVKIFRANVN